MLTETEVLNTLRTILDPDVGINIVDLGLVQHLAITDDGIALDLLMTTPACPQSGYLRSECARALQARTDATIRVHTLESPLWTPDRLSAEAKNHLGW